MRSIVQKYSLFLLIALLFITCVKKFNSPAIQAANNFLVVDGFINGNANEATTINLSRSRNLDDTVSNIPELNAQVSILSNSGETYALVDATNTGNYTSAPLNLNISTQYQLKIITSDSHQYLSDFVSIKKSAPIDSLTWQQDSSLTVYLSTHDVTNNSIYYKWDFVETWEHYAPVVTYWVLKNGLITYADSTDETDSCWTTLNSTNIITGTSVALSQDVISNMPITTIPQNDDKIGVRYSIAVRQIPLTAAAYNYWVLIEKNSQQLGTLFDPEPSQLNGNVHPITDPNEPVIGFISAAAPQEKRLFVSHSELYNWNNIIDSNTCPYIEIPTNPSNIFLYNYPDPDYVPWYFASIGVLNIVKKICVDCREYGGVNQRPAFWHW